jgi:hypothetical protein
MNESGSILRIYSFMNIFAVTILPKRIYQAGSAGCHKVTASV